MFLDFGLYIFKFFFFSLSSPIFSSFLVFRLHRFLFFCFSHLASFFVNLKITKTWRGTDAFQSIKIFKNLMEFLGQQTSAHARPVLEWPRVPRRSGPGAQPPSQHRAARTRHLQQPHRLEGGAGPGGWIGQKLHPKDPSSMLTPLSCSFVNFLHQFHYITEKDLYSNDTLKPGSQSRTITSSD